MTRVRKLTLTVAVLVLFCGAYVLTAVHAQQGKGAPKFFVKSEQVDVGDFYEGTDIEYEFTVRNNGVGELQILNVKPG